MIKEDVIEILKANPDKEEWADLFIQILPIYKINEQLDIAHFFAQICHESNYLTKLEENLNYSKKRLLEIWQKKFEGLDIEKYINNPSNVSDFIYKGFHGRGPIQLTWRKNVLAFSNDIFSDNRIVLDPTLLVTNKAIGIHSACWFWRTNNISEYTKSDNIKIVTKLVNGPACIGLQDRTDKLNKFKTILTC